MLTPKETAVFPPLYPFDVAYSVLPEAGYSSQGEMAENATIALSFKPTEVGAGFPLHDPADHALLLIAKAGVSVEVFKAAAGLVSYTTTAVTYADLLAEALEACCGSVRGYYSNLHVVDGESLPWSTFFELSSIRAGLWVWKEDVSVEYGVGGGYYPFTYAAGTVGANFLVGGAVYGATEIAGYGPDASLNTSLSDCWYRTDNNLPDTMACALPAQRVMKHYSFTNSSVAGWSSCPRSWDIEGSNDSSDGYDGTWEVVDSVRDESGWTYHEQRYFSCSSPGSFNWYRLKAIAGTSPSQWSNVGIWEGYESGTPFGLGTDFSGNGNHWVVSGIQTTDTPTNNLPVINPVPDVGWKLGEGNLAFEGNETAAFMKGTLPCFDGCYWEVVWTATSGAALGVIADGIDQAQDAGSSWVARNADVHRFDGTAGSFPVPIPNSGVLGLAYKNGNLWMSVDGVWDGDPAAFTGPVDTTITGEVFPFIFDRFASNIPSGAFRFAGHALAYPPPAGFKPFGG